MARPATYPRQQGATKIQCHTRYGPAFMPGRPPYYQNARGETVMSLMVFKGAKFGAIMAALGQRV